ncbi:hypothetical protein ACGFW5_16125 [Streptomyces sp. NPDC048416]|uniref:hypothetical protein n=1 Tax=Streptomyces sp. NPDC048416 TaxID=3365546 RepID=UPI003723CE1E
MLHTGGRPHTHDVRRRQLSRPWRLARRTAALLVAGGFLAACGSSEPTVGDSDASCSISAQPTVTGVITAYQVSLSAASNEVGYFSRMASVTVSGGQEPPTTTSEALDTPIPVPQVPGVYFVQASIQMAGNVPRNYRGVQCQLSLTVNAG